LDIFNSKRIKELELELQDFNNTLEQKNREIVEINNKHLEEVQTLSSRFDGEKAKILIDSNKKFSEIIAKYHLILNLNPAFMGSNITDQFMESLTEDENVLIEMYFKDHEELKLDQISKLIG
jgi:hypothetical protein